MFEISEAMPVLGSLVTTDGVELRVTERCLREDLGRPSPLPFSALLDGPVGHAFRDPPAVASATMPLSRTGLSLGSLLMHPGHSRGVVWIIACERSSTDCMALDQRGALWPTPWDEDHFARERPLIDLRAMQIKAPLALAHARRRPGRWRTIVSVRTNESVSIAIEPRSGVIFADVTFWQAVRTPQQTMRRLALLLSCIHPVPGWELVEEHPELDLDSAENESSRLVQLRFRHADVDPEEAAQIEGAEAHRASLLEFRNVETIRQALESHARDCADPPLAFLMNPADFVELGVQELWGVPVQANEKVRAKRVIVQCPGDRHQTEAALDAFLDEVTRANPQ